MVFLIYNYPLLVYDNIEFYSRYMVVYPMETIGI